MKARIIKSGRVIDVEYVGFDMDGYDIYEEMSTGIEWHEIELEFLNSPFDFLFY